ncbi:MAG TPA: erythromycin esterase family protein [Methanothrix sp.]|nr:erythromycin esterase family protein [Methanothrix sp.]
MMNGSTSLDEWIAHNSMDFDLASVDSLNEVIDRLIESLDESVELLGFGEALHGGKEILSLRNRFFERLVEKHNYSAIAIESSFPKARAVNEYISGNSPMSYEELQTTGFSHGFGQLEENRELIEWIKRHNAQSSSNRSVQFYGFDAPTEMYSTDSPRGLLSFVLNFLASIDGKPRMEQQERIDSLIGQDSDWEKLEALMDPSRSIGDSQAAMKLRMETEDLILEMQARMPELVARSSLESYFEAVHYARLARQLLGYHSVMAKSRPDRIVRLMSIREAMMASNLKYILSRQPEGGKVFLFAHNSHLQRGKARWQLGADMLEWWPVGSHLCELLGPSYAAIGLGIVSSCSHAISEPESGTLEAMLSCARGQGRLLPTGLGKGLSPKDVSALCMRSRSTKNSTYFPLSSRSLADFDWLAVLREIK